MLTKQPFWPHSDCVLYNSSCGDMFLHSSVCVRLRDSGWQTLSLCVADCSVSSKDKQWRVERVICLLGLNSSPWSPAGLFSLFFLCMLSYFEGEEHSSQCLNASILADAVDCVWWIHSFYVLCAYSRTHLHTEPSHIDMLKKWQNKIIEFSLRQSFL